MSLTLHRRGLLKVAAGGALVSALPLAACGSGSTLATAMVNPDLAVIGAAGGNVVAARSSDGVAIVDGGYAAESADVLASVKAAFGRAPVKALFNSNWRPNVTGLNETLGRQGVPIVAHQNTKQWLSHRFTVRWENKTYDPLPVEAQPTETFYETASMPWGGSEIDYGHMLQAYTDGDIYVHFPSANVLAAGTALTNDKWPALDWWTGGYIGGLEDALDTMLAIADDATVIVPGSGPLMTKADLQAQRDMYKEITDRLVALLRDAMSASEAVAAKPTQGFKEEWGNPDQFVDLAFHSFYGHLRGNPRLGPIA